MVVLTLALGIAATTSAFSIVNAVLVRPLPFPHSQQLYWVSELLGRIKQEVAVAGDYFTMRENSRAFSQLAAYGSTSVNWSGGDRPEQWTAADVTSSFFPLLAVKPVRGRFFRPEEDQPGADRVAILSYPLWHRRFGGDPSIVGRRIRLDRSPTLIVGIMPREFDFPKGTEVWIPMALNEAEQRQRMRMRIVNIVGRAASGVDARQLGAEMERLTAIVENEYPRQYRGKGFIEGMRVMATPLHERLYGRIRPVLLVFAGAVALMLLIVCFNVANLMLARATSRRREIAVCFALGAPARRIASQLLAESLFLAALGGLAGIALAFLLLRGLNAIPTLALQGMPSVSIDGATVGFTLVLTLVTGMIFGLAPVASCLGVSVHDALKSDTPVSGTTPGLRRLRQGLVVVQLALSLTLLIGAGLLAKSFLRLRNTGPGFRTEDVLTARVSLTGPSYSTGQRQVDFYEQVLQGIRRLPGVESAAITDAIPISDGRWAFQAVFRIENRPPAPRGRDLQTGGLNVSTGFFRTMGVPLLAGRLLDSRDAAGSPLVVVVNNAFVHRFFHNEDPLGRRISLGAAAAPVWLTIAGVIGDMRQGGLDRDPEPMVYRPVLQQRDPFFARMNFLIRTSGDPLAMAPPLERLVAGLDRDQPVFDVKTMEQRVSDSLGSRRFNAAVVGSFALLALILAALGVYGVMSYLVALRTQEMGIRMALGARPTQVLGMVVREGIVLGAAGSAIGVAGAFGLVRYLSTLLYGVKTSDPATFSIFTVLLLAIVIAACSVPGHRAARVDPLAALRHE